MRALAYVTSPTPYSHDRGITMKTAAKLLLPLLTGSATAAFAAARSTETGGDGVLMWFLIGFGVMVLLFQTVPALVMFFSLVKGLLADPQVTTSSPALKGKGKD